MQLWFSCDPVIQYIQLWFSYDPVVIQLYIPMKSGFLIIQIWSRYIRDAYDMFWSQCGMDIMMYLRVALFFFDSHVSALFIMLKSMVCSTCSCVSLWKACSVALPPALIWRCGEHVFLLRLVGLLHRVFVRRQEHCNRLLQQVDAMLQSCCCVLKPAAALLQSIDAFLQCISTQGICTSFHDSHNQPHCL